MEEVSARALVVLDAVAARLDRATASLFTSADFDGRAPEQVLSELRDRGGRFAWAALAAACRRLEAELGPARLEATGFEAVRELAGTGGERSRLRRALDVVVRPLATPRALRWLVPQIASNLGVEVDESPGAATVTVTLRPEDADGAAFLRLSAGMLAALPLLSGKPRASVAASIGPRRGRFAVGFEAAAAPPSDRPAAPLAPPPGPQPGDPPRRERPEAILLALPSAVGVLDAAGELVWRNDAFDALLALPPDEGKLALVKRVGPSDLAALQAALAGPDGARFELEIAIGGRPFDVVGTRHHQDPRIAGAVVELRAQEDVARRAVDLPGVVYRLGPAEDAPIEAISRAASALLGRPAEALIGAVPLAELVHPADRPARRDNLSRALSARRAETLEYRVQTPDGQVRWVMDVAHGLFDAEGRLLAVQGILFDWSARKHFEDQLLHAQKLDAIGRLAGGIAHDFNNLLGAMMGYADLAKSGLPAGDERRADIEEIEAAARRGGDLTRQLLSFARKQVVDPRRIDLPDLILRADKLLRRVLGENVELATLLPQRLWAVFADPSQVEQVIMNLAINARDAMPDGGKMTIQARNAELDAEAALRLGVTPGAFVELTVSDTGAGMPEDVQALVFEPFFTTKEVGRGTGLGLATVYGIIAQAGGRITIDSKLGEGTTFSIWLPRAGDAGPERAEATPTGPLPRGSEMVLLVEDHALVRRATARLLEAQGYAVHTAANASDALGIVAGLERAPDLLVTDVIMPEMSGVQLAERLRRDNPALRVLFVSGYADASPPPEVGRARSGFLAKPFTPLELGRKVREMLDGESAG